jgi:hypothetical protein
LPASRRELPALRRALILKLKALPTLIIRPRTPASRAKLIVVFTEARVKGRQKRYKGKKV